VCKSDSLESILTRNQIPVHQNRLISDQNVAIGVERGDLTLLICTQCGFIFNQTFESLKSGFGELYDSTQDTSSIFNNYLSDLLNYLVIQKNIQHSSIVEIGCGQGSFLRKLVEIKKWGNSGLGFDPSYRGVETDLEGCLKFDRRFFDSSCKDISANVILCRHVLAHIPEPINFLCTIRQTLVNSSDVRVFFETSSVEHTLQTQMIWDFFYEYCSYFSEESLTTTFEIAGFKVEKVQHVFGNQYLWLEAIIPTEKPTITKKPEKILQLAKQFASSEQMIMKKWQIKIQKLFSSGKIALWGAGAKGTTLANLVDPRREWIDCLIDLNPNKIGKYVAGTGHPIVSYKEIKNREIKNIVLVNPIYHQEVSSLLRNENIKVNLIC